MILISGRGRPLPAMGVVVMALLVACEGPEPPLAPLEPPTKLQAAEPRVSGAIPSGRDRLPTFEARGRPREPVLSASSAGVSGKAGDVTLNFVDTDIREIVRVILGKTLKLNYTIDPSVQGTATLDISNPLPRSELLPTLETLLNQNGATLVQRDGVYRVTPLAAGAANTTIANSATVGSGTQIVPLRYASAKDLAKVLEPFVTEGGKITADTGRNVLIVSGDSAVRQALISMIRAFDIDVLAGQSYALFPAGAGNPDKMAGELEKVFRSEGEGALSGVVRVLPLQRVNAVLVVSAQPQYIEEARRFFGLERRVEDATTRSWHVYYVQNGQSADLENVLQRAFTPGRVTSTGPEGPPGGIAPGAEPLRMASGRGGAPGLSGLGQAAGIGAAAGAGAAGGAATGLGSLSAGGPPGAPGPREGANPAAEPLSPRTEGEGEAENRIRIIANRRNNALLIYATPTEYAVIEGMLRKIDIIPLQVLIEATIAEVTLNDQLNYGTQFFLGHKVAGTLSFATSGQTSTVATIAGIPIGAAPNFPGFVLNNGAREVINALSAVTELKVLSAPQVMVLDNEPARLQVGSQVPILTQSQQSTISANAPIVNSVDYRDTGVILLVTPRVNSGGLVTLDISQEVSDVASQTTGNINSPTFDQRLIRTRVAIQDGQTVGLAGLIRDSDAQGNSGIPFLKDIPVLGTLVSSQVNSRQRTELLVLITPRVVQDQRDARALTEDLRNQLINAGLVRQELQRKPLHGSPNPNHF
jgi:general secretion pathway protein D